MKKTLSLLLALILVLGVCPLACADELEPATFSCFVSIPATVEVENNKVLNWFEDLTNTKFDFVVNSGEEMLSLLLNTGDYPEIIINNFSNNDIVNYGVESQIFVPIDEYIDDYMPNVSAYLKEHESFKRSITAPDGHIYGIPQMPCGLAHGSVTAKLWINSQWLENLGLEMPQTTDELYDVLVAFRDRDPNGNGIQDEIPLSGAIKTWWADAHLAIMNSFVRADSGSWMDVEDGKVKFVANTEEFKQGLYYLKKLYDEKLLDPACFTQDLNQLMQLGYNKDVAILGCYAAGHLSMVVDTTDVERSRQYEVCVTPASPSGRRIAFYNDPNNVSGTVFAITDACHDVPRALQTIDAMFDEENSLIFANGLRGTTWDYAEEGMLDFDGNQATYMLIGSTDSVNRDISAELRDNAWDPFRNFCDTSRNKFWVGSEDVYANDAGAYEYRLYTETAKYLPYLPEETMPVFWVDQDVAEEHASLSVIIVDYVNQALTRFVTGDMDIDTEWDAYCKALDEMGLDKYIQYYEDGYASAMSK